MKVLIVDDDREQLGIRKMLLESSGFDVVEASDGVRALHLARQHVPNCALMDLNLPTQLEGLALIRDLKAMDNNIHVLVLTGSDPQSFRKHPEASLVDEVFRKPTSSAALIRKLRAYA
jgi:two-component system, NarL family, response regulator EvgA